MKLPRRCFRAAGPHDLPRWGWTTPGTCGVHCLKRDAFDNYHLINNEQLLATGAGDNTAKVLRIFGLNQLSNQSVTKAAAVTKRTL